MGLKLSLHSVTSTIKSVTQTVAKTVSKAGGSGSSNKTSSSNKSNTSSKKQTGVSSKSAGSNKPASASNKANTKYVTNAPALYNASGKKTAGTSAGSLNRPAQSYEVQKKALEATRKKSVLTGTTNKSALKPVSIQVPITQKKKDPSEKATSNNRPAKSNTHVKDYTPTASREGAGKPFYHSGTVAKGVKGVASGVAGMLPYAGDVKDAQEVITGKDLIAGKKLTKGERIVTGAAAILPAVSGPMLRTAGKGAKIAAKEAPKAIKSAEKAGSKAVKKAAPKAVTKADDVVEQITIKSKNGTRTRLDAMGIDRETGEILIEEYKASVAAPLTKNQKRAHPEIEKEGGIIIGKGKPPFTGGRKIPPTKIKIIRKK